MVEEISTWNKTFSYRKLEPPTPPSTFLCPTGNLKKKKNYVRNIISTRSQKRKQPIVVHYRVN